MAKLKSTILQLVVLTCPMLFNKLLGSCMMAEGKLGTGHAAGP